MKNNYLELPNRFMDGFGFTPISSDSSVKSGSERVMSQIQSVFRNASLCGRSASRAEKEAAGDLFEKYLKATSK